MKIHDAPGQDALHSRSRGLHSRTQLGGIALAKAALAQGTAVACALWVSAGWAQTANDEAKSVEEELSALEAEAGAPAAARRPKTLLAAAGPLADSGDQPATAETNTPPPDQGIDEVVVTVNRRRQNLQDYSGTAAAFSEAKLAAVGVQSVADLSQMVPGLQIGTDNQGSTIYIRGIGSDNTTELGDPATAVHMDGVYLPRFRGLSAAWLDVERVEVNSGPQGTLRGRNATAGSINIISRKPVLNEYQANAEATFGTFRQRQYQGMINIPLGDEVAFRAAANSVSVDATWPNNGPIDHLPGAQAVDNYAMKGSVRWQPNSKLDVIVAGDYGNERGTGWGSANVIGLLQNRNDNGTELDLSDDYFDPLDPNDIDNPRQVFRKGRYPDVQNESWGARLSATYDTGPMQIELLASHRVQDFTLNSGSALGPFVEQGDILDQQWDDWSYAEQRRQKSNSTVGELRFASSDDENQRLIWSAGLFGFYEDQGTALGQINGDRSGGFNEFNMPQTIGSSYAAYADATFKATERLRLLAGVRFTREHKDRLGGLWMLGSNLPQDGRELCAEVNAAGECIRFGLSSQDIGRYGTEGMRYRLLSRDNYDIPSGPDATNEDRVNFFLDGIESLGARDQLGIALCNPLPASVQIQGDPSQPDVLLPQEQFVVNADGNLRCANGVRDAVGTDFTNARPQNGRANATYPDFRVGAEYDLAKDSMLYATLSSAHKSGGFNDSLPNPDYNRDDPTSGAEFVTPDYTEEVAYALEIGSKNLLLDRKLRLNASAFGYLYQGQQFQTIITVGQAPPLNADGTIRTNPETGEPFPDNRGGSAARQNAENASTIYGLDMEATYALPAGLEAELHGLLMNARYPDETYVNDGRLGLGGAPAQVDIGGNWLPRVSPYTLNYTLSQMIYSGLGSFDWVVQGQTRGQHYMTAFNGDGTRLAPRGPNWGVDAQGNPAPIEAETNGQYNTITQNLARLDDRVPTYTVVNLGVGWRHPDGQLSIRGFVNNAFNIAYANTIISNVNNLRSYNNPRMAGVRVRMDL